MRLSTLLILGLRVIEWVKIVKKCLRSIQGKGQVKVILWLKPLKY
jgi:hypothetical protein